MANAFVQNIMHITFHVAKDSAIAPIDAPRLYDYVGGIASHIHLLITVPKTISLSEYISKLKSNSSRWLKTVDTRYRAFSWQDGYGAFSVSASKIEAVRGYIANQAEHHRRKSYEEEVNEFWKTYVDVVPPLRGSE